MKNKKRFFLIIGMFIFACSCFGCSSRLEGNKKMAYKIDGTFTSDSINAKAQGLYGDGIHDDTSLLNSILSHYKRVYLPAGTYLISGTIQVPANVTLFGDGWNTIIQLASTYTLTGVAWRDSYKYPYMVLGNNSILKDILINGDETVAADQGQVGVMAHGNNILLDNVKTNNVNYFPESWIGGTSGYGTVNSPGYGISVLNSSNVMVLDCVSDGNGYEGIGVESSDFVTIDGCKIGDGNRTGIQIHRYSKNITLRDCVVDNQCDHKGADITIHGEPDNFSENLTIDTCRLVTAGEYAASIQTVSGAETNVHITGCVINSNHIAISAGYNNQAASLARKYIISDNIINASGEGIQIYGDEAVITDNIITAAGTPIYMSGQNSVIENNLILSTN